jgi:predicted metal-dependent hydrolase
VSMTLSDVEVRDIPTRRISFEESLQAVPKHFAADGDLIMSHIVAVLSAEFPDGEDFFVRSVRHFRDQITDPQLRRQVAGFMGQEAVHGREHRALNRRLAELGYPTERIARFTARALAFRERILSPASNLAATAALEHFTATLAEVVMSDPAAQELIGHPAVDNLLLWHALEESEHKAVAFDVFRAVGGRERTRTLTMDGVTVGFVGGGVVMVLLSLLRDPATYRGTNLADSLRRLRTSPFLRREVWRRLRDYNRPDFHPNDHDATALVQRWRRELFGEQGRLRDELARRSPAAGAV